MLVVEDVEDDCTLMLHELRRSGYAPTFQRVETPEAFLAALAQQRWDLVISDYNLPRFSAPQALGLLQRQGTDIPFVIVSGTVSEETTVAAMKAGAHDYLSKGQLKRLGPVIARELRESRSRAAKRKAEAELQKTEAMFRGLVEERKRRPSRPH